MARRSEVPSSQLTRKHRNSFHTISHQQFTNAVAAVDAAIPQLSNIASVVELIRPLALIGDGHTMFRSWELFRHYPFDLYWFNDQLRVLGTTSHCERALGTQLKRIGNVQIDDALQIVQGLMQQGENEWYIRQRSPFFLTAAEIFWACDIVPSPHHATYIFWDQHSSQFTLAVKPIAGTEPEKWIDARPVYYIRVGLLSRGTRSGYGMDP